MAKDRFLQESGMDVVTSGAERAARIRRIVLIVSIALGVVLGLLLSRGRAEAAPNKSFEADGFHITLGTGFAETGDRQGYDRAYRSNRESVYVRRESLAGDPSLTELSLAEYAARCAAQLASPAPVPETQGELCWFCYEGEEDGKQVDCLDCVYRGSDAFWRVHFVCKSGALEQYRESFLQYAATVKLP